MTPETGGPKPTIIRVVKKRKGGGGHHGGQWKVAFADFMTAMMAFFLVMWILGMDQGVKDMVQGYFNNPVGFKRAQSAGQNVLSVGNSPTNMNVDRLMLMTREHERERFEAAGEAIRQKLREMPELEGLADQIEIVITEDGLRIELVENAQGDTFFPFGSSQLKAPAARLLRLIAPELQQLGNGIVLEGHTDAVPFGIPGYSNWDLSTDRAHAARRAIEASGFAEAKILEIRGYADRHLRVEDNPYDPRNRRITMLLPFRGPRAPIIEVGDQGPLGGVLNVSYEAVE